MVLTLSICCFTLILGFSLNLYQNINNYKEELAYNTSMNAKLISEYCASAINKNDTKYAKKILDKLHTIINIENSGIYDNKGNLFSSYKNTKHKLDELIINKLPYHAYIDDKLVSYEPIMHNNKFHGIIFIKVSTKSLKIYIYNNLITILFIMIVLLILSYFLSLFLQQIITKPILKLSEITQNIAKDSKFLEVLEHKSNDEISVLYDRFNSMLKYIHIRDKKRSEVEKKLKETQEQFSSFMDIMPAATFIKDHKSKYLYVNQYLKDYYKAENWLDKNVFELTSKEKAYKVLKDDKKALIYPIFTESNVIDKNGVEHYYDLWKFPIKQKGKSTLLGGIAIEVSKRKQAEDKIKFYIKELEKNNKELAEFNYVASHDLREPLRTLTSYCELLKEDVGDVMTPQIKEDIDFISDAAKRMNDLILDLLELSRAGRVDLKQEPLDLNKCIEEVITDLKYIISESNGEITWYSMPVVRGDFVHIKRVLQNLLTNALTFKSDRIPSIEIHAKEKNNICQILITDNGIGIEKQYLTQIFSPFKKLHSREEYKGTGIGLAICKKIIERHGGNIKAESEIGKGSTFMFTLEKYVEINQ